MIKRILVGIADTTYTASATYHAIEIAKRCGASLTGISIADFGQIREEAVSVAIAGGYSAELQQLKEVTKSIDEAVDTFVRLCEEAGVDYEFFKVGGYPFQEFIERSKYHDLMVCGLQGLFKHGVLPEPKDELAKLVSAGVRPILATSSEYRHISRVLVAYSDSIESAKTMRRFTQLHRVLAPAPEVCIVTFATKEVGLPALEEARKYMRLHGIEPETRLESGTPRTGILDQAEKWNADLIVLGNSAKNFLRKQILGETALHTIHHAELPLFLAQ